MRVESVEPSRGASLTPLEPLRDDSKSGSFESSLMGVLDSAEKLEPERHSEQEHASGQERRADDEHRVKEAKRVDDDAVAADAPAERDFDAEDSTEASLAADTASSDVEKESSLTDEFQQQMSDRAREALSLPQSDAYAREGSGKSNASHAEGARSGAPVPPIPIESRNIESAPSELKPAATERAEAEGTEERRPNLGEARAEIAEDRNMQQRGLKQRNLEQRNLQARNAQEHASEHRMERPTVAESRPVPVQSDAPARQTGAEPIAVREAKVEPPVLSENGQQSDTGNEQRDASQREHASAHHGEPVPRSTAIAAATVAENLVESERVRNLAAATPSIESRMDPTIASGATNMVALPVEAPVETAEPSAPPSASRPMPPEAIPQHIEWLVARGGGRAEIHLHPPELGRLSIQVIVRGGDVQVVMNVQEGAAQTIVAEYRDSLESSLAAKDLKLDQFEVRNWSNRDGSASRDDRADRDQSESDGGGDSQDGEGQGAPRGVASALMHPSGGNDSRNGDDRINLRV
ncbi:MAG: flagellar hook-length control protein FliK [Myxococcales bacterium]|nr:flagellar hook-length control protein FliK [Myxococcales bacterium]